MSQLVTVVPCFNEARRLNVDAYFGWISASKDIDFIFVNDGSRDRTAEVLDSLRSKLPNRISVVTLPENRGKAEAVRLGMQAAMNDNPDFVAFWDADLATPLDEIPRFLKVFETVPSLDAVIGARVRLLGRHIERKRWRHFLGRIFASLVSSFLRLPIYDTQCGAKMFRAGPLIRDAMSRRFETRWLFDVEILARFVDSHPEGATGVAKCVYEIPVRSWKDIEATTLTFTEYVRAALSLLRIVRVYGSPLRGAPRSADNYGN